MRRLPVKVTIQQRVLLIEEGLIIRNMDSKTTYNISELASQFDVTTRTIRFYEAKELLSPERDGRARIYSQVDRERLSLILRGKRLGFNLNEVGDMLELYAPSEDQNLRVQDIIGNVKEHIDLLKSKRDDIDITLNEMLLLVKEYQEGANLIK